MKLSIHCEDRPWTLTKAFWIVTTNERGERFICKPMTLEFVKHENNGQPITPSMEFEGQIAQEFFPAFHAAMIQSGYLKPVKDESIECLKYHLEDMRKLVFEPPNRGAND